MTKLILILLAVLLLGSSSPAHPAPAVSAPTMAPLVQGVTISATVYGTVSGGSIAPIGEYSARGATLGEATQNAELLEVQIRTTATAQAVRP